MIRFVYRNLFANSYIPSAIPFSKIREYSAKVQDAHADICRDRAQDILGFYELPESDTSHIRDYLRKCDPIFDTMVVLGIGGSALGNKALYNALKTERGLKKKLYVYDNVDPVFLHEILQEINLDTTIFNVITKKIGRAHV